VTEKLKVAICCPTYTRPHDATLAAIEAAVPALDAAGFDHGLGFEVGCPYISGARATLLRKALDAKADIVVFLDHDVSFRPGDLVSLIQTEGDVVAGLYRYKKPDEPEEYMGGLDTDAAGNVQVRGDGCIKATRVPAGFLKVTRAAVERFMEAYPQLCFGSKENPSIDLFNHGAHEGVWWGEDMAFSRNWIDAGGEIWVIPDVALTHHSADAAYPGNYHQFLMRQPGGALDPKRTT
jgi:hypothetical protein